MAEEQHELVIIRHRHNHEESHHGGAWKIAFADFMTAMMALFLVLWLISTTTPKTKTSIARYFNPVKLVELTPLKKGFNDPVDSDAVPGAEGKGPTPTDDAHKQSQKGPPSDGKGNTAGRATHSETALFRDPYAVLAEIATADDAKQAAKAAQAARATQVAPTSEASVDAPEPFRDPFATIPLASTGDPADGIIVHEGPPPLKPAELAKPGRTPQPRSTAGAANTVASPPAPKSGEPKPANLTSSADQKVAPTATKPEVAHASAQSAATVEAGRLQAEIAQSFTKNAGGNPVPNVEVRGTDEGLLISLTDEPSFAMFAVGSAEPVAKTIRAMEVVAQQLKNRPGKIIIRGFTDGRPYKSANYDNWRLSSARAHMAQYMLIRGGLDQKRIAAIEGFADRRPKIASDPMAPENRRIEILLQTEKPQMEKPR